MIRACYTAEERHAVLRRPITGPHDLASTAWRRCAIHSRDCPSCVFATVVCDIQPNNRRAASRRGTFGDHDLGYLPVLPKVLVRPQGWYELLPSQSDLLSSEESRTHLFLGEPGPQPYHIHNVTLNYTHIGERATSQRVQLLAFTLSLLLLLCEALVARIQGVNINRRQRVIPQEGKKAVTCPQTCSQTDVYSML